MDTATYSLLSSLTLSLIVIAVLAGLSVVITVIGVHILSGNKRIVEAMIARLTRMDHLSAQLDGCQIENMPVIRQLAREEGYPLLEDALADLEIDSQKLFKKRWTCDPHQYLDRDHLLSSKQYSHLNNDAAYKLLTAGLLLSAICVLLLLTAGGDLSQRALPFAFMPAFAAILFFLGILHRSSQQRLSLDKAMYHLANTLMHRLPVFSDLAGTAVLVDAFIQYDRQMASSVASLDQTVKSLLNDEMVEAVQQAVEKSLQGTIEPAITEATNALANLAVALERQQSQGMQELTASFAQQVAGSVNAHLQPFFEQINVYMTTLHEADGETALARQQLEQYHHQAASLDASLGQHLATLSQQQQQLADASGALAQASMRLTESSQILTQLQGGSENSLGNMVNKLSLQMNHLTQELSSILKETYEENAKSRLYMDRLMTSQKQNLEAYQSLSQEMVSSSDSMKVQSNVSAKQLEQLAVALDQSVGQFNQALLKGVNQTLQVFDLGLAEMTDRLSATASELQASLPSGPTQASLHNSHKN